MILCDMCHTSSTTPQLTPMGLCLDIAGKIAKKCLCLFILTGPQRGTQSILFLAPPLLLPGFHVDQGSWLAPDSLHPRGSRADLLQGFRLSNTLVKALLTGPALIKTPVKRAGATSGKGFCGMVQRRWLCHRAGLLWGRNG